MPRLISRHFFWQWYMIISLTTILFTSLYISLDEGYVGVMLKNDTLEKKHFDSIQKNVNATT